MRVDYRWPGKASVVVANRCEKHSMFVVRLVDGMRRVAMVWANPWASAPFNRSSMGHLP